MRKCTGSTAKVYIRNRLREGAKYPEVIRELYGRQKKAEGGGVRNVTGLSDAGVLPDTDPSESGIDLESGKRFARLLAETAAEATGVPMMIEGAGNIASGYREGRPLRMLGGAGQVALGAVPAGAVTRAGRAALRTLGSSPMRSAIAGGAMGTPSALLDVDSALAQTRGPSRDEVRARLEAMKPADLVAYQKRLGVAPDGKIGPQTLDAAVADFAAQAAEQETRRQAALEEAKAKGDAARIEAEIRAKAMADVERERGLRALAEGERNQAAKTPIRDLYPYAAAALPVVVGAATGGTGAFIKGRYVDAFNNKLRDLTARWRDAIDAGDDVAAAAFKKAYDALMAKGPGGTGAAITSAAALGAPLNALPEEIDIARGIPGATERFVSPDNLKRLGVGAILGGAAGWSGGHLAGAYKKMSFPDYGPETEALIQRAMGAASRASATSPSIPRSSSPGMPMPPPSAAGTPHSSSSPQVPGTSGTGAPMAGTGAGTSAPSASPASSPPPVPAPPPPAATVPSRALPSSPYWKLPEDDRDIFRRLYLSDRKALGKPLPAKPTADVYSQFARQAGLDVVVSPDRIRNTNIVVDQFKNRAGRLPNARELARLANKQTLAVPVAAGLAAGAASEDEERITRADRAARPHWERQTRDDRGRWSGGFDD